MRNIDVANDDIYRYKISYIRPVSKTVAINCRYDKDRDIIDALKASGNMSNFIKKAIREYIAGGGKQL
jgi:hypothetical protein